MCFREGRSRVPLALLGTCICLVVAASAAWTQQPAITVRPNVQVSKARTRFAHGEVFAAADPTDPNRLVAASMIFSEEHNNVFCIVYSSFDGGRTWAPTLETSQFAPSDDPGVAYSMSGEPYFVAEGSDPQDGHPITLVYRSGDHGKTWRAPTILPGTVQFMHRQFVAIGPSVKIYVTGTGRINVNGQGLRPEELVLFSSSDGGVNFNGPAQPPPPLPGETPRGVSRHRPMTGHVTMAVLSDGVIVCLFTLLNQEEDSLEQVSSAGKPNAELNVVRSSDGGKTFSQPVLVDDRYADLRTISTNAAPAIAVDPGSQWFKDRLYAVWPDRRFGRAEILLSYSTDKGQTWSKARVVNDDRTFIPPAQGPDDFMPAIAVSNSGAVGVLWNDRRDNLDDLGWWTRFTASLDGGDTFLPSVRVAEAPAAFGRNDKWTLVTSPGSENRSRGETRRTPISVDVGVHPFHFLGGDYGWMTADAAGVFHPFWVDNRTGVPQVWTAAVTVKGMVLRNGSTELSKLEDVSPKVSLEITRALYDRSTGLLSLAVRLRNDSGDVLSAPLKARLVSIHSGLGAVQVGNTENGLTGPGAVWDFSPLLKQNELKPGDRSGIKNLIFRFTDVRPLRQGNTIKLRMVSLEAVVLAKPSR